MRRKQRPIMASRALLATGLFSLVIVAAACGNAVAGRSGQAAGPGAATNAGAALCGNAARVDTVTVNRTPSMAQSQSRQPPSAGVAVRDPAQARRLAAALCALPRMRTGAMSCPADFGGAYRLAFAAGSQPFPAVSVKASGCRSVSGLGPARLATAGFWRVLGESLSAAGSAAPGMRPAGAGVVP